MTDYKKKYLQSKKQYIKQKAGMYFFSSPINNNSSSNKIRSGDDIRRDNLKLDKEIKQLKENNTILNNELDKCKKDIHNLTDNLKQIEEIVQTRINQYQEMVTL
jgi:flagellar motility protein MotE (MotC chaperone)